MIKPKEKAMDLTAIIVGSISTFSLFVGLPAIVFTFIHKNMKTKGKKKLKN
jgi:predicted permease